MPTFRNKQICLDNFQKNEKDQKVSSVSQNTESILTDIFTP